MKKIEVVQLAPLETPPMLVQHFISLEGEGGTIGRSALFIRTGICSLRCNFCDSKFSVEGKTKYDIVDMTSPEYSQLLLDTYTSSQRDNITNLSLTGGEPLLHINNLGTIIENTLKAFPYISQVLIETNGTMLSSKENVYKLLDQVGIYYPFIKFTLSISPKLSGSVSYSNVLTDLNILNLYKAVFTNYRRLLDAHFDLQLKFVHSPVLEPSNLTLINYVLSMDNPLHKNQILIMPFTPEDPLEKDKEFWSNSKDEAAQYAMKNYFRYSPRTHVDRRLD